MYSIIAIDKDSMEIDDEIDYLHNSKYLSVSKTQELNDLDDLIYYKMSGKGFK